jgi:hypothetical protein
MQNLVSAWAITAANELAEISDKPIYSCQIRDYTFEVSNLKDAIWIIVNPPAGGERIAFRTAYAPGGLSEIRIKKGEGNAVTIKSTSVIGDYTITINYPESESIVLHYSVALAPSREQAILFWPRDIIIPGKNGMANVKGDVYISQTGTRSGLIYAGFSKPKSGSFLYMQNLTALADYNNDTQTSAASTVGGQWPELGFSLPPAPDKAIQPNKTYIISDALVAFNKQSPKDQFNIAKGFLNLLSELYLHLPRPETQYHDYPEMLGKALHDVQNNKGAWTHKSGHPYLNAYVCDYSTPPEIMVQLAVLLPVQDYMKWSGETCHIEQDIRGGLPAFYDEKLGTVMRWLPSAEDQLDKAEEQKTPKVMDAWYLHHPLLNLCRMALAGDDMAKDLLLKSVDYAIKVARHFNYCWPVFYHMETLEVLKAETKPGAGGEKDVAGLYAHVMLQIWELTGDKKYFKEAENAAKSMTQHGFDVFYQANNTMFSAKAMIRLYKETTDELYRDLAYLFLANIFKNVALWECNYGYSKNFPTFFALFPLNDAPYTAVYEEQETFAGVHEFLMYAEGIELLPAIPLLLAEFVRYVLFRAVYYYPPMLPKEMLSDEVKTGEVDPNVWIALEDLHDGWEKSGTVGQEVYGAGLAFGIVPRHFIKISDIDCLVFIDYPVTSQKLQKKQLNFHVLGDKRLSCRMCIVSPKKSALPLFKVTTRNGKQAHEVPSKSNKKGSLEFELNGDQTISITWQEIKL